MGSAPSLTWKRTYDDIKVKHDAAYRAIEEAISLEEQERPHDAIDRYSTGIGLIDQALDVQVECPEQPDATFRTAIGMIHKMKRTRAEVLMRINSIQTSPTFVQREAPPTYDEAVGTGRPRTYGELADALRTMRCDADDDRSSVEVVYTHDGVRMYFITPDGTVSALSEPQRLDICMIDGGESSAAAATVTFLQIGDWIYPLVPGVSPCYRTDFGAFVLPDVQSDLPNASIGIILPSDADSSVYDLLESILHGIVGQGRIDEVGEDVGRAPSSSSTTSETISDGLMRGAFAISRGLVRGAEKATQLINYGTPRIIGAIRPGRTARPVPVPLSRGMQAAHTATSVAVTATGFITTKVGQATMALGQYLAPHIQKQGTKLLRTGFNYTEAEASSNVNGVLVVAAGAVEGFSQIYSGLEESAGILGRNLADNTVQIVEHRYGQPTGEVVGNALYTAGNIVNLSNSVRHLTPKGLVKTAAKQTTKAVIRDSASRSANTDVASSSKSNEDPTTTTKQTDDDK